MCGFCVLCLGVLCFVFLCLRFVYFLYFCACTLVLTLCQNCVPSSVFCGRVYVFARHALCGCDRRRRAAEGAVLCPAHRARIVICVNDHGLLPSNWYLSCAGHGVADCTTFRYRRAQIRMGGSGETAAGADHQSDSPEQRSDVQSGCTVVEVLRWKTFQHGIFVRPD